MASDNRNNIGNETGNTGLRSVLVVALSFIISCTSVYYCISPLTQSHLLLSFTHCCHLASAITFIKFISPVPCVTFYGTYSLAQ